VTLRFEENIAADLDHFLTAVEAGWDDKHQKAEWIIYFCGREVGRQYGNYKDTADLLRVHPGYRMRAERAIDILWGMTA
jgi:hypothetical protein